MTEHEMLEAQKRADSIVEKVRNLVALESQVLGAKLAIKERTGHSAGNGSVESLEARLKVHVEELNEIADALKWATPCFRAYVLPQIGDIMAEQESVDLEERKDLESVIAALRDEENAPSSEALAAEIIARLRENLAKTFGS